MIDYEKNIKQNRFGTTLRCSFITNLYGNNGGGLSLTAFAASGVTVGPFVVTGGINGLDYMYENNTFTVLTEIPITIANVDPDTATNSNIVITKDVPAHITLAGVNIDVSNTGGDYTEEYGNTGRITLSGNTISGASRGSKTLTEAGKSALSIEDDSASDVKIILATGTINILKSGFRCAGLQKNGIVTYNVDVIGELTIAGNGKLVANGGICGAGIGAGGAWRCVGASGLSCSNIKILSGDIIANGGPFAAGIGGGGGVGCYSAQKYGSGDGSGGSGLNITISGGMIEAHGGIANGYTYAAGAGIGGGAGSGRNYGNWDAYGYGGHGENIVINGGHIVAYGESGSAGIGGGAGDGDNGSYYGGTSSSGKCSNVIITDGNVITIGGSGCPGIGGGGCYINYSNDKYRVAGGNCSDIVISGGTVLSTGGDKAAGIGSCGEGAGNVSNVTISGGTVTAIGTNGGAGIGTGVISSKMTARTCSDIVITGGSVKAVNSSYNSGLYTSAVIGTGVSIASGTANGKYTMPVNGNGNSVYLGEIDNPAGGSIEIDGEDYQPIKHFDETKIYAYLTDDFHVVTIDDVSKAYNPRTGQILPLPEVTAPTAIENLVYDTTGQTLIEAGETSNGTMKYALDKSGPWSTELPKATNADTYTVWYKSEGDNVTVASTNPESIEVTIAKAPWVFSQDQLDNISATSLTYEQTLADSAISGSDAYAGTYAWKEPDTMPTVADSNRTGFPIVFTPTDTNYDATEITATVTISKKAYLSSDFSNMQASDIVYGQTLESSSITGNGPIQGTFEWVTKTTAPIVNAINDFAVQFVPDDTDNYEIVALGDLHVTVNKADPIITAEQLAATTVSEITYGQTLADSTITATPTTQGTFEWSDDTIAPTVANSLNTDYEILFTPEDTDNYKTRTIYKTIKVNPAPIILSDAIKQSVTATSIVYEQTLSDSVLTGNKPMAGHYEWVDDTIAPSVADSNATAYDVIFVPDDNNYANAELTCTLSVSKKVFTLTQTDIDNLSASDLTYGQMLSQSIISGNKPVAGSYRFVDGATVPTVLGTNNFAVEFVPADTDNYEVSSVGDIHVTVNKAEPIVTTEQINAMTVSEITYGQTLADSTITATSTTPGTFDWNDNSIAPTVADSLTTEYNILFIPTDTDNYTTKLIAKTVKVNKATPTVPEDIATSISATGIKFGETLNDSTLSYTGSGTLTGNLSWTNPETVPAMADSDVTAYAVTYTPVDTVNYNTLAYTATVHVDKGEAPSSLQDFSTTVSTDVSEDSSGISTENEDGSITIDLSELLGIPGVSGIIKDVSDPNNMFDGTPVITDGMKLTYKTNPVPTDTTGTITVTVSSRDYEDFDIEITIKATNCPHEHVTNKVGYRAATCSTKGYTGDTVCDDCGCTITYGQDIATTSHTPVVKNRVAPTCTSEGYSGDVYCKDCGVFVASGRILATTEHTEGEPVVTKPATYDAEGEQRYYCKDCNAYIRSEAVPKLSLDGHEHVWVSGYGHDDCDHWKECTECHYLFDKAAHNFNDGDFITATCTTEGSVKYICTVCGYEVTKIETPGHRPVWRYDEHGDKHYKQCKVCGKVFESEVHVYGHWVETVTPTDSNLGTYVRSCTECGYIETVQSAANPEISSNTGGGETGQNNDLLNGGQTGSGKNPDTGIELNVIKFAALALVTGATILLSRKCKI